ncbi:MAG TPA: TIM barrel protein [Candidatus Sulfotelmatobacter sp.]
MLAAAPLLAPSLSGRALAGEWSIAKSPAVKFPIAPRERIAVASYPFREFIAGPEHKPANPRLELKDFAAHVFERFGVNRIEPWSAHFPSTDSAYLEQFRICLERAHATLANIAADGEHSPYAADPQERERAISFSKKWIEVATIIGSPSIRTSIPQANDAKPQIGQLSATLQQVAEYRAAKNIVVHLENDNPVSEDPFFLAQVIDKVNSPWLRALPDFGNTLNSHDEAYACGAIDAMFKHAYGICHVKNGEVNEQGKATKVDLARTFQILRHHDFRGYCSIEYDAPGDPYKATATLIAETESYLT